MSLSAVLGGLDAWTLALTVVSAGFYGSALVAVGSLPVRLVFPGMPATGYKALRRQLVVAAWVGIVLVLLQWPMQAAFLGGGALAAAVDPFLLGVVFESAQGMFILLAVGGLLLVQATVFDRGRLWSVASLLGLLGAVLVLFAFVQVGHTRDEPRWLLAGLLMLHLAAVAFWIAALHPLRRLAQRASDTDHTILVLTRFGHVAMGVVGLLLIAGTTLAWILVGGLQPLLTTAYGQTLLAKLLLVVALLGFAAWNKWRLVPALARNEAGVWVRLRRSIAFERVLVAGVLLVTALLTTAMSPGR